ncbi:MerR family transcriptional regulator, partial [Amycolatopsis circi]|uniref:MerR family transcriptional regulator n=1 Tax=Amycolatopsis circi TaxID=871959 RepID=UPI003CC657B8
GGRGRGREGAGAGGRPFPVPAGHWAPRHYDALGLLRPAQVKPRSRCPAPSPNGLEVAELPAASVATLARRGPASRSLTGCQALARWTDEHGFPREICPHTSGDERDWLVELREPFVEEPR